MRSSSLRLAFERPGAGGALGLAQLGPLRFELLGLVVHALALGFELLLLGFPLLLQVHEVALKLICLGNGHLEAITAILEGPAGAASADAPGAPGRGAAGVCAEDQGALNTSRAESASKHFIRWRTPSKTLAKSSVFGLALSAPRKQSRS